MLIVERGSEIGSTKMWTKYFMNKKEVETTIYKDTNATLDGNSSKQHQLKQGQRVIFYPKQSYEDEKNSGSLISLVGANGKPEKERYVVKFNVIAKPITKASTKENAGLKPTEILGTLTDQRSQNILKQITEKFKNNPVNNVLVQMTQDTINIGYPNGTYDLSGLPVEAVTDYFCEILHPISLLKGKGYTGNADEAFKAMGITKNDSAAISYNIKTTTGLKDSEIKNNEKQLYLSSKGGRDGKGAAAAASNLYNLYIESNGDDIRNTYNQFSLEEKKKFVAGGEYAEAISILEKIQNKKNTAIKVPVILAQQFQIINQDQMNKILEYSIDKKQKLSDKNLIELGNKLSGIENEDEDKKNYFWLISVIAKDVAKHINESEEIKFSECCCLILNKTTIQISTILENKNKNSVKFKPFDTVWPDNAITSVTLSADKRYLTTGIEGKFTFVISKKETT